MHIWAVSLFVSANSVWIKFVFYRFWWPVITSVHQILLICHTLPASLPYTQSVLAAAVAEKDNSSVSKVDIPVTQGWPEVFLFLLLLLFHFQCLTSIGLFLLLLFFFLLLTYTVTHVISLDNEYSWSWFTTAILHVGKWHLTTRFKCGAKECFWSFHNGWVRGWEMCKASHSLHTLVCDEKRLDSEILGHSFFVCLPYGWRWFVPVTIKL